MVVHGDETILAVGAAENGYLETLKWARENGCDWNVQYLQSVQQMNGHLMTLKWARSEWLFLE